MFEAQRTERPASNQNRDGLYRPAASLRERGGYEGRVAERSLYTTISLIPRIGTVMTVGAALLAAGWWRRRYH